MRIIFIILMIVVGGILLVTSINKPDTLADNSFLNNFVGGDLLNVLAVIVTITIASASHLHLKFNELEEQHKVEGAFDKARRDIRGSAYSLIWVFALSIVLIIIKAYFKSYEDTPLAICNSLGMMAVLYNIFVLVDVSAATFEIKPVIKK